MNTHTQSAYQLSGKPVTISDLNKSYGELQVLHDINLDVQAGEFCTLLGASGSGKSTLLKVLAGFEPFESGRLMVGERDLGHVPVSKRNIGMVFQNYALFPHMSVRDNVAFGLEMRKVRLPDRERRVDEALDLVSLGAFADRFPGSLSGGQQQRVALARALVIRPDILLMDEPLGALDKNLRQSIQLQLKELHRELGVTIIYVTHDQEEALHLSDTIVILDEGRIVQSGPPRLLYFEPSNRFVAEFLGECNSFFDEAGSEFGVRPEDIRLAGGKENDEHIISATIENVIFTGNGNKIVADFKGRTLVITIPNDDLPDSLKPGRTVDFSFSERQVIRF